MRNEKTSRGECWKDLAEVVEEARIDRFMRYLGQGGWESVHLESVHL